MIPGGRLAIHVSGSGTPIVLLHKLGGNRSEWDAVAAKLVPDHQVIVIEHPGHGDSVMSCEPPFLLTHAVLAAFVGQALDWIGADGPVDFVGSSIGASIALAFAAMFPDRTRRIVSLGASWTEGLSREALEAAATTQVGRDYDANGLPLTRSLEDLKPFGIIDQAQANRFNRSRAVAGRWLAPTARSVAFDQFETYLNRIAVPVTLAYGSRGHYGNYARKGVEQLASAIAVEIADASAFPHEDKPSETVAVIRHALA